MMEVKLDKEWLDKAESSKTKESKRHIYLWIFDAIKQLHYTSSVNSIGRWKQILAKKESLFDDSELQMIERSASALDSQGLHFNYRLSDYYIEVRYLGDDKEVL